MPIEIDKEIRPTDLMKNKTERTYLINDIITTERTPPHEIYKKTYPYIKIQKPKLRERES